MRKALAIDIGGTKIYNTIVNEQGEIIAEIEKRHTPKTFDEIKKVLEEIVHKNENEVDVIAFATCGAVNNTNDGIVGSTGNIAKTKLNISKIFFQERPYYEIIMAAYTKVHRKNKKVYIAQMNADKFEVIEKGKIIPNFRIAQGESITDSSYSETIDNMVNRVYIYNSDNKKIGSISNSDWVKKYGVFQNAISVESGTGSRSPRGSVD